MPIEGADPAVLQDVATSFERGATTLVDIRIRLYDQISTTRWAGPDARRFGDQWERSLVPSLVSSSELLVGLAMVLRTQARQQVAASDDRGVAEEAVVDGRTDGPAAEGAVVDDGPKVDRHMDRGPSRDRPSNSTTAGITYVPVPGLDPSRQFLAYDPRGDGRAVEVFGDLMSARRIGIWVPGVGTTVTDFNDVDTLGARRLWDASHDLVMIEWLGYDPPDTIAHAAVEMASAAGPAAADLNAFVDRLRSTLPDGTERTIIIGGHSYGATVAASAATAGTSADLLVLAGAPGVPATSVDQMTLNGTPGSARSVFVASNAFDPVRAGSLIDDVADAVLHTVIATALRPPVPLPVAILSSSSIGAPHPGDHTLWSQMHTDPTGPAFGATRIASGPPKNAGLVEMLRGLRRAHSYTEGNPRALESIRRVYSSAIADRHQPAPRIR